MHRQAAKFCLVASFLLATTTLARAEDKDAAVAVAPENLLIGHSYEVKVQRGNVTMSTGGELAKANDRWLAFRRNSYSKRTTQKGTELWLQPEYVWVPRYAVTNIGPHPQNIRAKPPAELKDESPPTRQNCTVKVAENDKPNWKEGKILEATDQGIQLANEMISRDVLLEVYISPIGEKKMVSSTKPNAQKR